MQDEENERQEKNETTHRLHRPLVSDDINPPALHIDTKTLLLFFDSIQSTFQ
jgi:hypothetical protein